MPDQVVESGKGGQQAGGTWAKQQAVRRAVDALSDKQQQALALVTEGKPIKQVGEAVGVDRGTIYRWMRTDPHFRAAYNAWQLEQRESYRAALLKCAETAVAKVIRMVDIDGDLAWKIVKELGLLDKAQPLQTDPGQVEREIALERMESEALLSERRATLEECEADATLQAVAHRVFGRAAGHESAATTTPTPGPTPVSPATPAPMTDAERNARNGKL